MKGVDHARRQILAWGAAMAGVAIAPGITLFDVAHGRPPSEPASRTKRWGMLVDVNRCSADCNACVVACDRENGLPIAKTATSAQWIRKVELKDMRGATKSLPMMCQHCAEPPLRRRLPDRASFKRADGIVLVDRHTCIGCRYCMMACPYKARSFVHEPVSDQKPEVPRGKGCVESCTLCVHRIGPRPASRLCRGLRGERPPRDPVRRLERPRQRDLEADRGRRDQADARRPEARHRRALPGDLAEWIAPRSPVRRAAGSGARLPGWRRGAHGAPRRAHHGSARARRHRHGQPGGLGHAARVRDLMIVAASGVLNVASIARCSARRCTRRVLRCRACSASRSWSGASSC